MGVLAQSVVLLAGRLPWIDVHRHATEMRHVVQDLMRRASQNAMPSGIAVACVWSIRSCDRSRVRPRGLRERARAIAQNQRRDHDHVQRGGGHDAAQDHDGHGVL
jgi:hypothetical protein